MSPYDFARDEPLPLEPLESPREDPRPLEDTPLPLEPLESPLEDPRELLSPRVDLETPLGAPRTEGEVIFLPPKDPLEPKEPLEPPLAPNEPLVDPLVPKEPLEHPLPPRALAPSVDGRPWKPLSLDGLLFDIIPGVSSALLVDWDEFWTIRIRGKKQKITRKSKAKLSHTSEIYGF